MSTRCSVIGRTPGRRLSTRSTVAVETPARRATSAMRLRGGAAGLSTSGPRRILNHIKNHHIYSLTPGASSLISHQNISKPIK